jgi:hypothetical protein
MLGTAALSLLRGRFVDEKVNDAIDKTYVTLLRKGINEWCRTQKKSYSLDAHHLALLRLVISNDATFDDILPLLRIDDPAIVKVIRDYVVKMCAKVAESLAKSSSRRKREGTILILGKELAQLPWESLPSLHEQSFTRMPSFGFIFHQLAMHRVNNTGNGYDTPVHYIVNASGEFPGTVDKLASRFTSLSWIPAVPHSTIPSKEDFKNAIQVCVLHCIASPAARLRALYHRIHMITNNQSNQCQ